MQISGDFCLNLLLFHVRPVLREEFHQLYITAATTNKDLDATEASQKLIRIQGKRLPQDVLSNGLNFIRPPSMPGDFRKLLEEIPKWNRHQIETLYNKICRNYGRQEMKQLIDALFIMKTQDFCYNANIDPASIQIKVPDNVSFVHLITVNLARSLWQYPGVMKSDQDNERELQRARQFDEFFVEAVQFALAEKSTEILHHLSFNDGQLAIPDHPPPAENVMINVTPPQPQSPSAPMQDMFAPPPPPPPPVPMNPVSSIPPANIPPLPPLDAFTTATTTLAPAPAIQNQLSDDNASVTSEATTHPGQGDSFSEPAEGEDEEDSDEESDEDGEDEEKTQTHEGQSHGDASGNGHEDGDEDIINTKIHLT